MIPKVVHPESGRSIRAREEGMVRFVMLLEPSIYLVHSEVGGAPRPTP